MLTNDMNDLIGAIFIFGNKAWLIVDVTPDPRHRERYYVTWLKDGMRSRFTEGTASYRSVRHFSDIATIVLRKR